MREQYDTPEMEIIVFKIIDILTVSDSVTPEDNWWGAGTVNETEY